MHYKTIAVSKGVALPIYFLSNVHNIYQHARISCLLITLFRVYCLFSSKIMFIILSVCSPTNRGHWREKRQDQTESQLRRRRSGGRGIGGDADWWNCGRNLPAE